MSDELPVACTLGPADGRDRIAQWRALRERAGAEVRREGAVLTLRFEPQPGVLEELSGLAAAEAECCGFVTWHAALDDGAPTLTVTGDDPAAVDAIAALFGQPTGR
jgi:hypothetical protein